MRKVGLKNRILSFILAATMICTNSMELVGPISARAEGAEDNIQITVSGGGKSYNVTSGETPIFDYGTMISMDAANLPEPGTVEFSIKEKGTDDDEVVFDPSKVYEVGTYSFGYKYEPNDQDSSKGKELSLDYELTIQKSTLAVPTNLSWSNGSEANWDIVKTDKNGNGIPENPDYKVILYKNGGSVAEETVKTFEEASASHDFKTAMLENGVGEYSFTVQAIIPEGNVSYAESYAPSSPSDKSSATTSVVKVKTEAGTGIETAKVGDGTEMLVIPGSSTNGFGSITAKAASEWTFKEWTTDDSNASIEDATASSTKVTVAAGAASTVIVTANAQESNPPIISSFAAGTDADEGKLIATVTDCQSGLAAYAFSTKTDKDDLVNADWTTASVDGKPVISEKEVKVTPEESGTYYFYAKDADGNVAKSDSGIDVSKVIYNNYFEKGSPVSDKTEMYVGDGTFELPDLSDAPEGTVHRKGYTFAGWYKVNTPQETDEAIRELNSNNHEDIVLFAKWEQEESEFDSQQSDLIVTYSGTEKTIASSVKTTSADVTYILYKKNTESAEEEYTQVSTNKTGTFSVRDVSDSGTYRIDAKLTSAGDDGKDVENTLTGNPFEVTIPKAAISVRATNITVTYGDVAPESYAFVYEGLLGDDEADGAIDKTKAKITSEGTLSCEYTLGTEVKEGGYPINFSGSFASENYDITMVEGVLTVKPKNVEAEGSGVTLTLTQDTYTYDGTPKTPLYTIKDGEDTIAYNQYEVTYDEEGLMTAPSKAGDHTLKLTFKNNYVGTLTVDYHVGQNTFTAVTQMDGWEYGESAKNPSVADIPADITNYSLEYYYMDGDVTPISLESVSSAKKMVIDNTSTYPTDAGIYTVFAVIKDLDGNYEETVATPCKLEIAKRKIYIKAKSSEEEYDGNEHHLAEYTLADKNGDLASEQDVFVLRKESFRSITVTGSIKDVTLDENGNNVGVPNIPSYELTSVTNADNYDIECVPGTLKLTPQTLLAPANLQWDAEHAGLATWVAITKQNLLVEYEVKLYEVDGGQASCVETVTTRDTSVSFLEKIHTCIAGDHEKSFYFTVAAKPYDSTDAGKKTLNDYIGSEESAPSQSIYTVTITLTKKLCIQESEDQTGFDYIKFADEATQAIGKITLITGESVDILAKAENGYYFTSGGYETHADRCFWYTPFHPTNKDYVPYFSTEEIDYINGEVRERITVNSNLDKSISDVAFTGSVEDHSPSYHNFKVVNDSDNSGVIVTATVTDTIGLKYWGIQQVTRTQEGTYEDGTPHYVINVVKDMYIKNLNGEKSADVNYKVTEPGLYRLIYDDTAPDIYYKYGEETYFNVYEIKFEKGNTSDEEHTMAPLYKLENTSLILPDCAFTKDNYSFKNWAGEKTGISTANAEYKANMSDTLVAQWTNDQYRYYVEYYYMSEDGSYPENYYIRAEYKGGAGTTVTSEDAMIQKNRTNYSLDASRIESVVLSEADKTLKVYYSTGNFKITYKYTLPGAEDETVVEKAFYTGQTVVELAKPTKVGYTFVGWRYEGFGAVPEKMPAKDIVATGNFIPAATTYTTVYHLETLGEGTTHTEEFDSNTPDAPNQLVNATQGDVIHAYINLPENPSTGQITDITANEIPGFRLVEVVANTEADMNNKLPEENLSQAEMAEGIVSAEEPLYIHYYFVREEYTLTNEVWKNDREAETNRIYKKDVIKQYGESIDTETDNFSKNSYYETLEGFSMPESYVFASYTDYSTGTRPTAMPAGDVTVIRDIIPANKVTYSVKVFFEKSSIGSYDLMTTLNYEAVVGQKIEIVESVPNTKNPDTTYITYTDLQQPLVNGNYYTHVMLPESVESGIVKANPTLELAVYFERKTTNLNVEYYYGNDATKKNNAFASFTLSGKWGSTYTFDPIALFDAEPKAWLTKNEVNGVENVVKADQISIKDITTSDGSTPNGRTYDFRNNSYLVSYETFYDFFDSNDVRSWIYPDYTFTTVGTGKTYEYTYKVENNPTKDSDVGIGDYITGYFGINAGSTARCRIYYNEIKKKEDFYLDVRIAHQNFKDKDTTWYTDDKYHGVAPIEYTETDGSKYSAIPVTYTITAADATELEGKVVEGAKIPVRIINKCAVVNGSYNEAGTGITNYPAANAKTRSYTYTDDSSLHKGFTKLSHSNGNYYYYDGSCNSTGAYGSTPYVYITVDDDRFLQGAYVGYTRTTINGKNTDEYQQAIDYREKYVAEHGAGGLRENQDNSATATYINNASYGHTYVYGDYGYLTYNYAYREECQLSYYYNGNTCSSPNHKYTYGTELNKATIYNTENCSHSIPVVPAGYEIVWYMDSAHNNPVPQEGFTINENRTLYGQMEKSTIQNKEYIYFELADPVTVGDVTYRYVSKDNLAAINAELGKVGKEIIVASNTEEDVDVEGTKKKAKTTVYTLDGTKVLVEKERPTLSYTELHLSKAADVSYKEAYASDMDGFYYDETNTDNRSYGYVNTTPLNLKVYFARDKYQVEVHTNVSETSNPEINKFSIGQQVILDNPTKPGYTFAGWKWEKKVGDVFETYEPTMEDGENYFKMPAFDLRATAQWNPGEFNADIMHYFQTSAQNYDKTFVENISGTPATDKTVRWGENTYSTNEEQNITVSVYGTEDSVSSVVIETPEATYYFRNGTVTETGITVTESELVAAKTSAPVISENEQAADAFKLTEFTLFDYAYTTVHTGKAVDTYKTGTTYPVVYGMDVEYYYSRSADQKIHIAAKGIDGGNSGMTYTGDGECFLGEAAKVQAYLTSGYSFIGWFEAKDVLADYPDSENPSKALDDYSLKDDIETLILDGKPVATGLEYNFTVDGNRDLIALTKSLDPIAPTLSISGKFEYTYGYAESSDNMLLTIAKIDGGAKDADKTKVNGYTWYLKDENGEWQPIDGGNNSTYFIPTGFNAGTYSYKCVVAYERTDNGKNDSVEIVQDVEVKKANMTVTTSKYEGIFDNHPHAATISVNKPVSKDVDYEIYYANEPITAANFETVEKMTEIPTYTDVNNNGTSATAHTTYFYVKDKTGNYNDYEGSEKVNIIPKQISIKALGATFTKMYDASDKVNGDITTEGTDRNLLAKGNGTLYTLSGFVSDDENKESYLLGCDATYNSMHVLNANSLVIQDLYLVVPEGTKTYNYSFPASTTLTFAGNITARPLQVQWDEQSEFVYTGTAQAPGIQLAEEQAHPIPDADKDYFNLAVTGQQINIGTYKANAKASCEEGGSFLSSDYVFDNMSKEYKIVKRAITIVPNTTTLVYDGKAHTISPTGTEENPSAENKNYKIYLTGSDTEDTVVDTFTLTMSSVKSYTNANESGYTDMAFEKAVITDSLHRDITENYDITYGKGTLIIRKAPVTVSGITAEVKHYDGKTDAVIHLGTEESPLVFTGVYTKTGADKPDQLSLDEDKVTGTYDAAAPGTTKVNIEIADGALTGPDAENYTLDIEYSQKEASGNILQAGVLVAPESKTVVYGETVAFTSTFTGIYDSDGNSAGYDAIVDSTEGSLMYQINTGTADAPIWVGYSDEVVMNLAVRTYPIRVNPTGLTNANHRFEADPDAEAILTVTKRPVSLVAVDTADLKKTYDGTKSVTASVNKATEYAFEKTKNGAEEVVASGVLAKDSESFDLSSKTLAYDIKNVGDNSVHLTNAVINNENYELVNTSVDIKGSILAKELTITAQATTITYGDTAPDKSCKVTCEGFVTYTDASGKTITETVKDLPGTVKYRFATYNTASKNTRNAGTYTNDITPYIVLTSGETEVYEEGVCGNYEIHYVSGTLTVEKATMTLTADNQTLYYKVGNTIGGETGQIPVYTYKLSAWKYVEDSADYEHTGAGDTYAFTGVTLPQTETGLEGDTAISKYTVPREEGYPIKIKTDADGIVVGVTRTTEAQDAGRDNYVFKAVDGKLTVVKHALKVTGLLHIPDKVYDGTTDVVIPDGQAAYTEDESKPITFDGIDERDITYGWITIDFEDDYNQYPNKKVGTYSEWTLSIGLNDYLDARYELDSESLVQATSSITQRPVRVKAVAKEIKYGSPVPQASEYSIEEEPYMTGDPATKEENKNLVSGEAFTSEYTFSGPTDYTCAYCATIGSYSEVGDYSITPVEITATNYNVEISSAGQLRVVKNKLATPAPIWDATNIGTVTWNAISEIGDVATAGYIISLYKNGTLVADSTNGTVEAPYTSTSVNYASVIRANGGGQYTVKVQAIASKTKNESNKNVLDSDAEETSVLYATTVTPSFDGDTEGKADDVDGNTPIYLNNDLGGYTLIAGEAAIPVKALLKNATGYTAKTSGDTGLTIVDGTSITANAEGQGEFTGATVCVAATAKPAATTNLKIKLTARDATVAGSFSAAPVNPEKPTDAIKTVLTYGYSDSDTATLTADVQPSDSDNITSEGYTYTVRWEIRYDNSGTTYDEIQNGTSLTCAFPTELPNGNLMPAQTYRIKCYVTATRNDNGKSTEETIFTSSQSGNTYKYLDIKVKRGTYKPVCSFGAETDANSWVYGTERKLPGVSGLNDETKSAQQTFYFSKDKSEWSTNMITDVGTYYVKAEIAATDNYEKAETEPISYVVKQAKLATPTNLQMTKSDTAPYGKYTWDQVIGPQENNNNDGKSDSHIDVKYEVELYRKNNDTDTSITKVTTADTAYDFSDMITEKGTYGIHIKAIVDEERSGQAFSGQDRANCADSELNSIESYITIGADVTSNLQDTGKFVKEYDGTPLVMTVEYNPVSGSCSYQWMKNGNLIDGATNASFSITYVEESATYTCKVIDGPSDIYSKPIKAEIKPRPITILTADASKTYDGTALVNADYKVAYGEVSDTYANAANDGIVANDAVVDTFDVSRSVTNVSDTSAGNHTCVDTTFVIKRTVDEIVKTVYAKTASNNNYVVKKIVHGTLTINPLDNITVTITEHEDTKTYNGQEQSVTGYDVTSITSGGAATELYSSSDFTFKGTALAKGTYVGSYDMGVKAEDFENNNTNFTNVIFTIVDKQLTITPISTQIVVTANSDSKKYDGTALTNSGFTYTPDVLVKNADGSALDEIFATVEGTITDFGETGTAPNKVTGIKVMRGGKDGTDVTDNYTFGTSVDGTLTITKRSLTMTSDSASKTYDGSALTKNEQSNVKVTGDGFVSGEGAVYEITGSQTYVGSSKNNFTYTLNDNTKAENYTISTVAGDLTVNKISTPITITANSKTKMYDGTALTDDGFSYTDGVLKAGDVLSAVVEGTITNVVMNGDSVGSVDNVVTSYKVTRTVGEAIVDVTENYTFTDSVKGKLTITKRNVTLTSASDSKKYDGTALTRNEQTDIEVGGDGFVDGEGASYDITGTITDYGTTGSVKNAFTYTLNSNTKAENYNITKTEGTLSIERRTVTLTSATDHKTYDGTALTNHNVTVGGDGFAAGEGASYNVTGTITDYGTTGSVKNAFTYTLNSNTKAENYIITKTEGILSIDKVATPIIIKASSAEKIYDGTPLTAGYTYTDGVLRDGDQLVVVMNGSITDYGTTTNKVASYKVLRGTGETAVDVTSSYTFGACEEATLSITKRNVTLTSATDEKTYDGTALIRNQQTDITVGGDGFADGEGASYVITGTRTQIGTSENTFTYTLDSGVKASNYDITTTYGTLTILGIDTPIIITAASNSAMYDGKVHTDNTFTYTENVLVEGDTLYAVVEGQIKDVGTTENVVKSYQVKRGDVDVTANYTFGTPVSGTLEVTKRSVVLTSASASKTYDKTPLVRNQQTDITVTGDGFVAGEGLETEGATYSITGTITDKGTVDNAFTYQLTSATKAGNYDIETHFGTLTIKAIETPITITAASNSKKYDGAPLTDSGYTYTEGVLLGGDVLIAVVEGTITDVVMNGDVVGSVDNEVTSYKVMRGTTDVTANYTFNTPVSGTLTITKRNVTLTSATDAKAYDGTALTNHEVTVSGDDFISGEGATYNVTGTITNKGSVSNKFTYELKSGTKADNYHITQIEGTLTVAEAGAVIVTITGNKLETDYSGFEQSISGYTVSSNSTLYGEDNFTFNGTAVAKRTFPGVTNMGLNASQFVNKDPHNFPSVLFVVVDGSITIDAIDTPITITANSNSKVYDGTPLTDEGYTYTQNVIQANDELIATVSGSQTAVGTSANIVTGYKVMHGDVDVTEYYTFGTSVDGILAVTHRSITLTADDAAKTYDGLALVQPSFTQAGKVTTDTITLSMTAESTLTKAGSIANVIDESTIVVTDKDGNDVTSNYTFQCADGILLINKKALTVKALPKTYVYDGTEKTWTGLEAVEVTGLENEDQVSPEGMIFSGAITNVGSVDNTPSQKAGHTLIYNAAQTDDMTDCYEIHFIGSTITVEPRELVADDLSLIQDVFVYDGSEHEAIEVVTVDLNHSGDRETILSKGTDYTITEDVAAGKVLKATEVGTYTVEVTGQGNYTGTVSKTFAITDTSKAEIKDANDNPIEDGKTYSYCKIFNFEVTDPNFDSVKVVAGGEDVTAQVLKIPAGADNSGDTKHFYIVAVGDDPDVPVVYTITVKDVESITDGVKTYHEQTFTAKVYPDHRFTFENYVLDTTKEPTGFVYVEECEHDCHAKDYLVKAQGEITWEYAYSYDTPDGPQSGTQNRGERDTYAIVKLMRNGTVIAETLVNCDAECGNDGSQDYATIPYMIDKDGEGKQFPYLDENGTPYNYSIDVHSIVYDKEDGTYTPNSVYHTFISDTNPGAHRSKITYFPGVFDVPWKITLTELPTDEDGELKYPDKLYVKVLYANEADAEDDDYNIISQQVANLGEACEPELQEDGSVIYTGSYPCWTFIGGSDDTYYHRIQVTGYEIDGTYCDITDDNYKSICDDDHINHTVTYDLETEASTGTILYDLNGILPAVLFYRNDGTDKLHNSIWKGIGAFEQSVDVTAEEVSAIGTPSRGGYTFAGWYTEANGGTKIEFPITLIRNTIRVYAHWNQIIPPKTDPEDKPTIKPVKKPETPTEEPANSDVNPKPKKPNKPGSGKDEVEDIIEDEQPVKTPDGPSEPEENNKKGSLEVIVEHTSDVDDPQPGINDPGTNKPQTNKDHIFASLPKPDEVADIVLTDEEKKILAEDGNIIIKLIVDDQNRKKPDRNDDPGLYELIEEINSKLPDVENVVFDRFIDLELKKKINDGDWIIIPRSDGKIEVCMELPASVLGAKRIYIARQDGNGGYEILEDLDDNPSTITILVDDFGQNYVLLKSDEEICYWHWLIFIISIIYLLVLLITMKKEEEDDEEKEGKESAEGSKEEESLEKRAKKSRNKRWISMLPYAIVLIVATYFGFCKWEISFDVIGTVLVSATEYGTYKHKFKELKDKEK